MAGFSTGVDLHPEGGDDGVEVRDDGTTVWRWRGEQVHLPLRGRHNVRNALLALGVAEAWGVPAGDAIRGISEMPQPKLRGEWRSIGRMRVIADCYNANPASVNAAVDILASLPAEGEKIGVLGTMRELGVSAPRLHREVAEHALARLGAGIDRLVATGEFVDAFATLPHTARDERVVVAADPMEAYEAIAESLRGDETILLKASRGEALERWIDRLETRFEPETESPR